MSQLAIEGLDVHYGAVHALKQVSMRVEAGEIVTLIGANGAGKTTLLRTISGLVPARAGRIVFEGRDIAKVPAHEIVALGISQSPEGRMVFANLSVEDNLELGAYRRRDRAGIRSDRDAMYQFFPLPACGWGGVSGAPSTRSLMPHQTGGRSTGPGC